MKVPSPSADPRVAQDGPSLRAASGGEVSLAGGVSRLEMGEGGREHLSERERQLSGALHEVSNAMTVVLGWLEAAETELAMSAEPLEAVRRAISVARSHAKVGHLLARQSIGSEAPVSGRYELDRDVRSVALDAKLSVTHEAKKYNVEILLDDAEVDHCAVRSPLCVQQILTNLLLNAIAFSPRGGEITLQVKAEGTRVLFAVSDQGPGVPEELREAIFRGNFSTREGGAGIGLAHSAELARNHGGQLSLSRSAQGARFELRWGFGEVRSATRQVYEPRAELDGLSVLVIEDDPGIVSLLELSLSARGARVFSAGAPHSLEAVLKGGGQHFDVALVDLSPIGPSPGGWLRRLIGAYPELQLMVISGSVLGVPDLPEVAAWLRKPFEMAEVVQALRALVPPPRA